ncbi:MAG: hypothetical protein Q8P56_05475 [Candidatus Uhrbacteria bacterium]|nr:hypothetical protein [Candidatus Uhrbacteria bacterium]
MKKIVLSVLAVAVIAGGGSFWGGMQYAESKGVKGVGGANGQGVQRSVQFSGQNGAGGRGMRQGAAGGFVSGDILSKDDASITVKLPDGGSKIIFFSDATEVGKFVTGTKNDLEIGKTVTVTGKTNTDGSVTAQSIQMRPSRLNQPTPTNQKSDR